MIQVRPDHRPADAGNSRARLLRHADPVNFAQPEVSTDPLIAARAERVCFDMPIPASFAQPEVPTDPLRAGNNDEVPSR